MCSELFISRGTAESVQGLEQCSTSFSDRQYPLVRRTFFKTFSYPLWVTLWVRSLLSTNHMNRRTDRLCVQVLPPEKFSTLYRHTETRTSTDLTTQRPGRAETTLTHSTPRCEQTHERTRRTHAQLLQTNRKKCSPVHGVGARRVHAHLSNSIQQDNDGDDRRQTTTNNCSCLSVQNYT